MGREVEFGWSDGTRTSRKRNLIRKGQENFGVEVTVQKPL